MRLCRSSARICCLLFGIILLFSVAGVSAQWSYGASAIPSLNEMLGIDLNVTIPTELPSTEEDSEAGTNHYLLVDSIINDSVLGLNTPNSELNQNIEDRWVSEGWWDSKRTYVGSMASWTTAGSNLDNLFGTEAAGLEFIIRFVDDDNGDGVPDSSGNQNNVADIDYYYVYTTDAMFPNNLTWGLWGNPLIPIGQKIYIVYRTIVTKNDAGKWVMGDTLVGTAKSANYATLTGLTSVPAFNPDSWVAVNDTTPQPGLSSGDPLWTYVGRVNEVPATRAYFAFKPVVDGDYLLCAKNCSISIRQGTNTNISITNGRFTASTNYTYYVTVSSVANENIIFCIEGTNFATAGLVKLNTAVTFYPPTAEAAIYSMVPIVESGVHTVECTEGTVRVYNSDQELLAEGTAQNVTFTANADTTYYIVLTGVADGEAEYKIVPPSATSE